MRIVFPVLFIAALASGYFAAYQKPALKRSTASLQNCPDSAEGWGQYFYEVLRSVKSPYEVGYLGVKQSKVVWNCESSKKFENVILNCLEGFDKLKKALRDEYAMGVDPTQALAEQDPRMFTIDPAFDDPELIKTFRDPQSSQADLNAVIANLMKKLPRGARSFQFQSATAHHRAIVTVIPGKDEDLFVHYHADKEKSDEPPSYLVARAIKSLNGQRLILPKMEFYTPMFFSLKEPAYPERSRCISCHRAGTIKILPVEGSIKSLSPLMSDAEVLPWFDKMRPKYADRSDYDFSHLGPEMGPEDPPFRTLESVRECARTVKPDITEAEVKVVKKQMNCVGCHDVDGPGSDLLRFPMHARQFGFNIFDNIIRTGYMPKEPKTPANLREPLLTCLKWEFFGGFKDFKYSQGNEEPGILMREFMAPDCPFPQREL